jgi:histidine triad (HIT) family protein
MIPAKMIASNSEALAFLDAFPLVPGHSFVISRRHKPKLQELSARENQDVCDLTAKVAGALEEVMQANATTIAIHNGREAGQEIEHLHVHMIPRRRCDGAGPVHSMFQNRPTIGEEEMENIRARISSSISKDLK